MAEAGPLVNPGIFNANDPRGSEFAANQAALEHQYGTTLAGDQETLQNERTNAAYQRSLIAKQEPISFKANEARANTEGLLESGVNAGRRGNIQADFVSKGTSVSQKMTQAEARRLAADNIARESEQTGTSKNIAAYQNDKLKWEEEHPPLPPPEAAPAAAPAANPGGAKVLTGPVGPGGVQPYEETSKRGFVRVGAAPPGVAKVTRQKATRG
jgi:hypothetical protein